MTETTNIVEPETASPEQPASKPCSVKDCGEPHYCRGWCKYHYQLAWKEVKRGNVTWRQLERKGEAGKSARDRATRERRRLME